MDGDIGNKTWHEAAGAAWENYCDGNPAEDDFIFNSLHDAKATDLKLALDLQPSANMEAVFKAMRESSYFQEAVEEILTEYFREMWRSQKTAERI